MMCAFLFFILGLCSIANAAPSYAEDRYGSEVLLVPVQETLPVPSIRHRRQTTVDITKNPSGTDVTLGHKGTIFENDKHKITGQGLISKHFEPTGPITVGGGLGYEHLPSGSRINVDASNTRGFGTDLSATATANLWKKENSRLDAYANYNRHYGGPYGTGDPNYGVGLQFIHRF